MRSHFTILLAANDPSLAKPFDRLGAIARFVPIGLVTATLKVGNGSAPMAEAILIDGKSDGWGQQGIIRALSVANEIRDLPDYSTMPNGIRWRHIPIVIVVPTDELVERTRGEPWLASFTLCSASRGWPYVHRVIEAQVRDFGQRLVEQFRSIGWEIREEKGRYFRGTAPSRRRKHGVYPDLETELYDGRRDRWFRTRTLRDRLPLMIVHTEPEAVKHDLDEFNRIIPQPLHESAYQSFLNSRSYILRSAPFELLPQAELWDPDANAKRLPDYSQRHWQSDDGESLEALRFIEIKKADTPVLVRARSVQRFGGDILDGIAQLRHYRRLADDPRVQPYRDRIFPNGGTLGIGLVIAGRKRAVDPHALEWERKLYEHEVEIRTYDELLEDVERRYLADYQAPQNPYGLVRLGYPSFDVEAPDSDLAAFFDDEPTKRYRYKMPSNGTRVRRREKSRKSVSR